jgi:hypothetical protein
MLGNWGLVDQVYGRLNCGWLITKKVQLFHKVELLENLM